MGPATAASIDPKGKARTFDKQTLWPCDGGEILVSLNARRGRPKGGIGPLLQGKTPKRRRETSKSGMLIGFRFRGRKGEWLVISYTKRLPLNGLNKLWDIASSRFEYIISQYRV